MINETLLRKITIKDVTGGVNVEHLIAAGKQIDLMDVMGLVTKYKAGSTKMGEFVKFGGEFKATNLQTGEVFRSGACILPNFVADMIAGALQGNADERKVVSFAFRISVHYDESAITKYVYDVRNLRESKSSDVLANLEKEVLAALPSPKPSPKVMTFAGGGAGAGNFVSQPAIGTGGKK